MALPTSYNPYAPPLASRPVVPNVALAPRPVGGAAGITPPVSTAGRGFGGSALDALGTPGGQFIAGTAINGLGAYVASRQHSQDAAAQAARDDADRAQRAEEARQNALRGAAEAVMTDQRARATGALRDLGEGAGFSFKQAQRSGLADIMGTGPSMPGNARIAARMGNVPTISPEVLARMRQASSPNATAAALAQRDMDIGNINPASQGTDLSTLTGLRPDDPFLAQLIAQRTQSQQHSQGLVDDSESYAKKLLAQAIDMPSLVQPGGAAGPGSTSFPESDDDVPYRAPRQRNTGAAPYTPYTA